MKKIFVLIVSMITCLSSLLHAQHNERHEFRLGYGDGIPLRLTNDFASGFIDDLISGATGENLQSEDVRSMGTIFAGYRYRLNNWIKIGGDIGYMHYRNERSYLNKSNDLRKENNKFHFLMVLPTADFTYLQKGMFAFYGSVSAGAIFVSSTRDRQDVKDFTTGFAYQINPVGLRIGKKAGGFLELGFGYKGIGNIGVYYAF